MSSAPAVAIGRLRADGPWLGIVAEEAGFRLAVAFPGSAPVTSRARGTRRIAELLAAAIAYFEEALDPPPPEHPVEVVVRRGLKSIPRLIRYMSQR